MFTIYGKAACPQCDAAKRLCKQYDVEYQYLELGVDFEREDFIDKMQTTFGVTPRQMPQVVNDKVYIGSTQELKNLLTPKTI